MNLQEYIADRETREPAFFKARESLRLQYELRRALIAARLAAGLTQAELARQMGTTQSAVARLESGAITPTVETLCHLADALGIQFEIAPQAGLVARGLGSDGPPAHRQARVPTAR